ncbi:McKusick-Kaufman/Bardet-Biedl syndromes putative chaperonin [Pangasianodon hypophthalmus]|uniref:McKusick-Kaufman/Bardet-Biedl syndromes putative chaperonin n=1 Tax=Pangasianodon hypophthalmus TaxID=310915 RepID=UPI00230747FB|nr:McKusick-Kaufman/Bardet-Biedl syndromes putative chaperonin [Pangasianodon hypophthalmus]
MSRVCKKKPSVCTDEPLTDDEMSHKLAVMRHALSSCYGPRGRLKQIHNSVGGQVQITSTSAVLLRAMAFSEPLIRLISAAILDHSSRFSDCGLFTGVFCLGLIENGKRLGLGSAVASRVYKYLLEECNRYLNADDCGCKVQVDFSSIRSLITLAHTAITSKPACMLNPEESQHIASLIVQAFLRSVPSTSSNIFGRTLVVTLEGPPVSDSAVFPGLLVEVPILQSVDLKNRNPGPCKIVLFGTSLSGDCSEIGEAALEIQVGINPEKVVLEQLLKLGERVVQDGVGVFACQKVIHPVLQQYLKERGLVVIERLGLALIEPIAQMTGALIMASICSPVPAKAYGQLGGLHLHRIASKELLQLLPSGEAAVSTMVLCHRNETMLEELKVTCQRAEHVLRLTLKEPYALIGGGCTETVLSAYIKHTSESKASEAALSVKCSRAEFLLATEAFCCSLHSVALSLDHDDQHFLMDLTHAHCWVTEEDAHSQTTTLHPCCCGLVKERADLEKIFLNISLKTVHHSFLPAPIKSDDQPRLLDSFTAKLNALNVAVETANLMLNARYIIRDVN